MDKFYFSQNNITLIYNILREKLLDKYKFDINQSSKFKEEIINIMKSIYNQKEKYNIDFNQLDLNRSSIQLTKITLKTIYDLFSKYIVKTNHPTLYKRENVVDSRPIPSNINENMNINKKYELFEKSRKDLQTNNNTHTPKFTENINEDNTSINQKFEEISKDRNIEIQNIVNEMNESDDNSNSNLINQFNYNTNKIREGLEETNDKQKNISFRDQFQDLNLNDTNNNLKNQLNLTKIQTSFKK